ncbi:MAG: alpha-L-arabinofuranosidase C-terminal domain-containing protein [Chitinophagaceae bacterium]
MLRIPSIILSIVGVLGINATQAQTATINVHADQLGARVSPELHGAFFEEISHGGEGGLYAELIQNRGFEDAQVPSGDTVRDGRLIPPRTPHYSMGKGQVSDWWMPWTVKSDFPGWRAVDISAVQLSLSDRHPLNAATPHNLQITIQHDGQKSGVRNDGFWGINIQKGESYLVKFYLWSDGNYNGNATVSLIGKDGKTLIHKMFPVSHKKCWVKYTAELQAVATDSKAHFELTFDKKGTVHLDFVSLFPKHTFKNRPNGLRADLAQKIADLKPAFLRWPGGCFVEGINIQSAPNWKETIGPVESRKHAFSVWDYYTSNGFGYDEYLRFCEDIGAKGMYVLNVGISCEMRSGTFVTGDTVQNYVRDALDAISYAIDPVTTKWGALRAKNGHPKPYPLEYVEVGNEQHGAFYADRYNLFYDAIHAQYPQVKIIAAQGIGDIDPNTLKGMKHVQYADEHSYKGAYWSMGNYDHFDKYPRDKEWKLYVGEYATNNGVGRGNMVASLSDAVYIMGMERNSDLVQMSSYAPLLVHVDDEDWPVNLINFDNARSFGRISYYLLKMMNENKATVNIASELQYTQPDSLMDNVFKGGIGLATWDTHSDYKDIRIEENGKTVYQSDFARRPDEWNAVRGTWKIEDSTYSEVADGAQTFAFLKDRSFANYTLKLKARKRSGYNGFIIPFAVKDTNTFNRLHIGAWLNAVTLVESVNNGYDVGNLSSPARLPFKIEQGKWYDITLNVMGDSVSAYIDGQLLIQYKDAPKFFAIAGKDELKKEIVLKIVNAYPFAYKTTIHLSGVGKRVTQGTLTSLSAPNGDAENSFEHPTQYVPVTKNIDDVSNDFQVELQPNSIDVIRLKEQ